MAYEEEVRRISDSSADINTRGFTGVISDSVKFVDDGEFEYNGEIIKGVKGEEVNLPIGHNLVVDECSKLIAMLLKNQAGYKGIKYWEVGSGQSSWIDTAPPNPIAADKALNTPTFRKVVLDSDITFLDASNNPTATPTNKLQVKVTFLSGEANGHLREFGLFGGGTDCNATLGSGHMVNRKTHGVIFKSVGIELSRVLRLTF